MSYITRTNLLGSAGKKTKPVTGSHRPEAAEVISPHSCGTFGSGVSLSCCFQLSGLFCSLAVLTHWHLSKQEACSTLAPCQVLPSRAAPVGRNPVYPPFPRGPALKSVG